ncbi:FlgO family outer membrane protein [Pseudaeromonas sharmana]|uniref:FlgO family outer membrane protein n=1 Tax=Pseudaeromonas sharmana TaxID=328412 RepID=A0ABV8CJN8_9GAMM
MKKTALWVGILVMLAGCSSSQSAQPKTAYAGPSGNGTELNRLVSDLADRLFQTKLAGGRPMSPIAVTSFVNLSTLESTNWLGQQLAEDLVHELHRRGEIVFDYKLTGSIKVTPEGDYVFSRDWTELAKRVPVSRVLTGTMSRNANGVVINARIVSLKTHMVEATAQGFVPASLLMQGNSLDSGRAVTITKGMLVRGEYPGQYSNSVELTH